MAYALKYYFYNEDTGRCSSYIDKPIYETKALADYFANQANHKFDYDVPTDVVIADNSVYIKQTKEQFDEQRDDEYYGSPTHQMFGDAWLYRDCPEAW
jgi:hypothetical protein